MIDFITGSDTAEHPDVVKLAASLRSAGQPNLTPVLSAEANLANKYNKGAAQTNGKYLGFVQRDTEILSNSIMFDRIEKLLDLPDTGIVGVCGAMRLNTQGTWWGDAPREQVMAGCRGAVGCPDKDAPNPFGMNMLAWPGGIAAFGRVLVVDGVLLMCSRATFEKVGGYDESLVGPHFYDIDISLRAHVVGLKNYAAPILMFHNSTGHYNQAWETTRQAFLKKWAGKLPISL